MYDSYQERREIGDFSGVQVTGNAFLGHFLETLYLIQM